jgi:trimeric autotransporter adhesin
MRNYTHRLALMAAVSVGGLALLVAGLVIALGVRSVVAGPSSAPAADPTAPNPGHAWTELQDHGVSGSDYWLGTTDNNALELRVNGARALRLEPNAISPNVIGGYSGNSVTADAYGAAIGGGGYTNNPNVVTDDFGTVGGGVNNRAGDGAGETSDRAYATVGGGAGNQASGYIATVSGGVGNWARGSWSTIGGGGFNDADGEQATVGGGQNNHAWGSYATVGGGSGVTVNGSYATVGGGSSNTANGDYATVGGGGANQAIDQSSTVGGGTNNVAGSEGEDARWATVGGGEANIAGAIFATVGGGMANAASGWWGTIAGGYTNTVSADHATVGGGSSNTASATCATVGGGSYNEATNVWATVSGGLENVASAYAATVPGGERNTAAGANSFAAGTQAKANGEGCFVWADKTYADFICQYPNQFIARASGGVYLYTNGDLSTGAYLASGSGSWSSVSDRNLKDNFTSVDGQAVLASLAEVPIATWNYKAQDSSIRHMGPMSQDLYAAFGLGESETAISTVDADGVALAAIQGLYQLAQEQAAHIDALEAENAGLHQSLDGLEERVAALEGGARTNGASAGLFSGLTPGWLLVGGLLLVGLLLVHRRRAGG